MLLVKLPKLLKISRAQTTRNDIYIFFFHKLAQFFKNYFIVYGSLLPPATFIVRKNIERGSSDKEKARRRIKSRENFLVRLLWHCKSLGLGVRKSALINEDRRLTICCYIYIEKLLHFSSASAIKWSLRDDFAFSRRSKFAGIRAAFRWDEFFRYLVEKITSAFEQSCLLASNQSWPYKTSFLFTQKVSVARETLRPINYRVLISLGRSRFEEDYLRDANERESE